MILKNIRINKIGLNGEGIGYSDRKIVFVPFALPNEIVDVEVIKEHPKYIEGKLKKLHHKSPVRVKAKCGLLHTCQACSLMELKYEEQLNFKKKFVEECFSKYARLEVKITDVIANPQPYNYRNSVKLPLKYYKDELHAGLFQRNSNYFVKIDYCDIHDPLINEMVPKILDVLNYFHLRDYNEVLQIGLRYLILRTFNNEAQLTLVTGKDDYLKDDVITELLTIKGLVSINVSKNIEKDHTIFGSSVKNLTDKKTIEATLGEKDYLLSPQSFFQLNTIQAKRMYDKIAELLEHKHGTLLELYAGVGSIGLYLESYFDNIIGLEIDKKAVENANNNARRQKVSHAKYLKGDIKNEIVKLTRENKIDVLIVDPTRTGLDQFSIETIMKAKPKKIFYISCNPATLAKNMDLLQKSYRVKHITVIDMFSHTPHIETIVYLQRRAKG